VKVIRFSVLTAVLAWADLSGSYLLPLDHDAIQYAKAPVDDPVARLARKVARGEVKLEFEEDGFGYLRSMLKALDLSIDSQVLVFSKTSFQAPRIGARTPRALYFNDQMSLGFVRGGDVLELAAVDPKQGVIFYTLDQEKVGKPRFERRDQCLQCHQSGGTLGVPGLVVRSVYPERSGMPLFHAGTFVSDHRSPLKERWGGWYVSGTHGAAHHMGNAIVPDPDKPDQLESEGTQNLTSLRFKFDTTAYLSPHSDIVALLTLEHQTRMTNLITRVGYETRLALHSQAAMNVARNEPAGTMSESTHRRIDAAVEELVSYMLFQDEVPLEAKVRGVSAFTKSFAERGPRDQQGRSLREFDLEKRIFRYPLSYMIYSESFDGMPEETRKRVYRRLYDVLEGKIRSNISELDRVALVDIVSATKKGLPDFWVSLKR
jgi:hypothetical protein